MTFSRTARVLSTLASTLAILLTGSLLSVGPLAQGATCSDGTATDASATACGSGALALGTGTTAVGVNSFAGDLNGPGTGSNATAVGNFAFGAGLNSIAIGYQPLLSAPFSGAFGADSIAIGTNALAGVAPTGPGANAIALGNLARATGDNSVAFGPGATATQPNQMVFGVSTGNAVTGAASTYFLPGLTGNTAPAQAGDVIASVNPGTGQVTTTALTVTPTGISLNGGDLSGVNNLTVGGASTFSGPASFSGGVNVTGGIVADTLSATNGTITNLTATNGNVANLTATNGTITNLAATNGTIDNLLATNGTVTNLIATNGTVTNLTATNGTITNLTATNGTIDNLLATNGTVTNLIATNGTVTNLTATNGTVTNLTATNATITTANVGTVNVANAFTAASGATIDMGGNRVQDVATPVAPTDAANKAYVDSGLNQAFKKIDENAQGIAIALAMGGIYVPEAKTFSVSAGYGNFDGAGAFATQMALRLNPSTILSGGIGVGLERNDAPSKVGGRVGLQYSW